MDMDTGCMMVWRRRVAVLRDGEKEGDTRSFWQIKWKGGKVPRFALAWRLSRM
jgi:hypothetical protein